MSEDKIGQLDVPTGLYNLITLTGHHYTLLHIVREYHLKQTVKKHYKQLENFCNKYQDFEMPDDLDTLEKHYLFNKFEKFLDKVSRDLRINLKEQDTIQERIQTFRMSIS